MAAEWSKRQRRLLAVGVLGVAIVLGDIVALNVAGEVSSAWWVPAVPIGLFLIPIVSIVCFVMLVSERRRT